MNKIALLGILLAAWVQAAGSFEYLKKYDQKPATWTREITVPSNEDEPTPARVDLGQYYDEFFNKGELNIYYGLGVEAFTPDKAEVIFKMLMDVSDTMTIKLVDLKLSSDKRSITFKDSSENRYKIDIGSERDAFARSFASYPVVMYHGHSRYGRGPAFETFQNYFRMGHIFKTIEINAENPYFLDEETQLTSEYPLQYTEIDGKKIEYQYKGQKDHSSYLSDQAFTRNVEGWDKDFVNAEFYEGKQIFWLYSCRNIYYWKNAIRDMFPNTDEKFVFGTKEDGYWSEAPAATFIASIVQRRKDSDTIVKALNDVKDCNECFTSY